MFLFMNNSLSNEARAAANKIVPAWEFVHQLFQSSTNTFSTSVYRGGWQVFVQELVANYVNNIATTKGL